MDTQRLTTAREVAEACGLSTRTVYDLAARGDIPCWRFGSAVRFDLQEVLEATRSAYGSPTQLDEMDDAELYEALGLGAAA